MLPIFESWRFANLRIIFMPLVLWSVEFVVCDLDSCGFGQIPNLEFGFLDFGKGTDN